MILAHAPECFLDWEVDIIQVNSFWFNSSVCQCCCAIVGIASQRQLYFAHKLNLSRGACDHFRRAGPSQPAVISKLSHQNGTLASLLNCATPQMKTRLFFCRCSADPLSQLFVNLLPMADSKDPDNPRAAIQFIDNAKSPDFESPQPRQF